jgi:hypothetical protein
MQGDRVADKADLLLGEVIRRVDDLLLFRRAASRSSASVLA